MKDKFPITPAKEGQLKEILALQKIAYKKEAERYQDFSIPPMTQTLEEIRKDFQEQHFLVMEYQGRVIGSVKGRFHENTCSLERLMIDPEFQGKGLGKKLIQTLEDHCRKKEDILTMELFTGEKSYDNIGLYRGQGYEITEIRPFDAEKNIVIMTKELPQNRTLQSYNRSATSYEARFANHEGYNIRISQFAESLPPKAKVLDLGCGPGFNSRIFSEKDLQVTGLDFSESMIELAKKNCPSGDFERASVLDYETNKKYQGLCLSFLIVHLTSPQMEILFKKLAQWCDDDALVYICFMTGKESGFKSTSFTEERIYFHYHPLEWVKQQMKSYHFELEKEEIQPYQEPDGSSTDDVFLIFKKGLEN